MGGNVKAKEKVKRFLKIDPEDNVATALADIHSGEKVEIQASDGSSTFLTAKDPIPFGHKIALEDIQENAEVIKYGSPIGEASKKIQAGEYVHTQNLISARGKGNVHHE